MQRPNFRATLRRPALPRPALGVARALWAALVLSPLAGGCATQLLNNVSATSPASPEAPVPAAAPAGTALRADPPLPGEDATGWPDLGTPAKGGHQHHQGHGADKP